MYPTIQDLNQKLDTYLTDTFISQDDMRDLVRHYQISGIYNYSFYNSALIKLQGGTICQSFLNWKKLERFVKKGERAHIEIAIPFIKKVTIKDDTIPLDDSDSHHRLCGFGYKKVFDIAQTKGKPLVYEHNSIEDHSYDYDYIKDRMSLITGKPIKEDFTGGSRGYVTDECIVISSLSNNIDSIKTLIHETAHDLLGHLSHREKRQGVKEVEAETVSGLVLSFLKIDFRLTTAYIQSWKNEIISQEADKVKILQIAEKIILQIVGSGGVS